MPQTVKNKFFLSLLCEFPDRMLYFRRNSNQGGTDFYEKQG